MKNRLINNRSFAPRFCAIALIFLTYLFNFKMGFIDSKRSSFSLK